MKLTSFSQLAYAYPKCDCSANFKQFNQDFVVDEVLPFELSGTGEHAWLHIKKQGENTEWVAKKLAEMAGVRKRNVGYAGLKDRHAVTTQWFSVHMPGMPDPDWSALEDENITVLSSTRHSKKLRRGALKENRFSIVLRALKGDIDCLNERCRDIQMNGVPNYFGQQRFGHDMANLESAEKMFSTDIRFPRHKKSLFISAARSWIFNQILSQRIMDKTWNQYLPGDVFMLEGKSACFKDDETKDEIGQRLADKEIHPTGVLWGIGEHMVRSEAEILESNIVNQYTIFKEGLESFKVQRMRRALRVVPGNMKWLFKGGEAEIKFTLPSGSYATMVLRELLELHE